MRAEEKSIQSKRRDLSYIAKHAEKPEKEIGGKVRTETQDSRSAVTTSDNVITEIARKEQKTLSELLRSLQKERDAIISFSFEGLIQENNRKEEILKELEYLRDQKEKSLDAVSDKERILASDEWRSIARDREVTVREVRVALQKNMRLLSFSVDHVKSSIEHIIEFIGDSAYGRKPEPRPLLLSKVV